jgi:hypothetical protein
MNQLLQYAYLNTDYQVDAPGAPFKLNIGCYSPELDQLHQKFGVSTSLYITAWNPFSDLLTDEENNAKQQMLVSDITDFGFDMITGRGIAQSGDWPSEESIIVLGCDEGTAITLSQKYQQNVVVFSDEKAIPGLIETE